MSVVRKQERVYVVVPDGNKSILTEKQAGFLPLLQGEIPNYWEMSCWDRQSFDSMWKKGLIRYRSPSVEERFIVRTVHLTEFGKQVLVELDQECHESEKK